jgi:hypothetical protein
MKLSLILNKYKPKIKKKYLLFIAAFAWTIAGTMLLYRGILMSSLITNMLILKLTISLIFGIIFYLKMFTKISLKHINRIKNLKIDYPCLFSFFNIRSYFLMVIMILMGVSLRKLAFIPITYLSLFYIMMSVPLLFSAIRFYLEGFRCLNNQICD